MPQHRHLEAGPFLCFLLKVAKNKSLSACFFVTCIFWFWTSSPKRLCDLQARFFIFFFLPEGTLNTPLFLLLQPRTDSKVSFQGCTPSGREIFFPIKASTCHTTPHDVAFHVCFCAVSFAYPTPFSHPDFRGIVSLSCSKPRFLIRCVFLRLLHKEGSAFRFKRTADNWLPFNWEDVASALKNATESLPSAQGSCYIFIDSVLNVFHFQGLFAPTVKKFILSETGGARNRPLTRFCR